jgi:hypothetical protein
MLAKDRFWLNYLNGLLPKSGTASEQDHPEPVLFGYQWAFHLSVEDDQIECHAFFDMLKDKAA